MEFEDAAAHAAEGASKVFPQCSKECVQHQIEQGHDDMHQGASAPDVKYAPSGRTETPTQVQAQVAKLNPAPSRSGGR